MPFANEYREVYDHGIRPAAERAGFECFRADDAIGPRNIISDIVEELFSADAIIADITGENPNVFYELGVAHAISNKTIMICQQTTEKLPFDLASYRTIFYESTIDGIKDKLCEEVELTLKNIERWVSKRTNPVQDFRPFYYSVPLLEQAKLEDKIRQLEAELARIQSEIGGKPEIGKMTLIPSGVFPMGDENGRIHEKPVHDVFLNAFLMDVYPVTNELLRQFIHDCPDWRKQSAIERHRNVYYLFDWHDNIYPRGKRNHPVVWVNWYAAVAFCNWRSLKEGLTPCYDDELIECNFTSNGYRLPTEAEYEKATRGSLIKCLYPWGNDIDESNANYDNAIGDTTEVGKYSPNAFGLYDIAGNVKEWCNDWFDARYYENSPKENPRGPKKGEFKVFRSGSWGSKDEELRCACRAWLLPPNTNPDFAFRCVKLP